MDPLIVLVDSHQFYFVVIVFFMYPNDIIYVWQKKLENWV
jgi:hypothetical protein